MQQSKNNALSEQTGMSLVEVVIAIAILSIAITVCLTFITSTSRSVIINQDQSFAMQKALSMVNELRAYADANVASGGASVLDTFDDGVGTSPKLTIDSTVSSPDHILSGNRWVGSRWHYSRRITVRKFASFEASNVRIVTVKIFLSDEGKADANLMADITSVITTMGDTDPTTQVYDIYLLGLENIPGWWVYLAYLTPFIENALTDMEARNPGMEFRRHWITKAAYGRDPEYKPYFNNAADSNQDINYAYFYPGSMPSGSAVSQYYVPENVKARINIDGATTNDYSASNNPYPYALADQYNHAMRYPDELALYQNRLASGQETLGNLTYRLLLDDMVANPANYRNAIFINLHGELVPMPSVRNYSDPAKDPESHPGFRSVTHPQKLCYDETENLTLRVYAYTDTINSGQYMTDTPISIIINDMDLRTVGDLTVTAIKGGTDQNPAGGGADTYAAQPASTTAGAGAYAERMYYEVSYDTSISATVIKLYKTPLWTPETTDNRGLDRTRLLYGRDYIPCPVEAANNFSQNLAWNTTADRPKNTARWIITISSTAAQRELLAVDPSGTQKIITFKTRLGDDLTTGTMWPTKNKPQNLSSTYIYWNYTLNDIPFSESYQFQGDPRHCPYSDIMSAHRYNWYFDNLRNTTNVITEWPSISATLINNAASATADGWHGGGGTTGDMLEIDVPRFFLFLRTALTNANCVWTTITGFSYYYMGLGNEIGYDASNGFTNSIPISPKPFTGASGSRNEDSITTAQTGGVKYIREKMTQYWWGRPWLGELYPDTVYVTQWAVNGNLNTPIGTAEPQAGKFVRIRRQDIQVGAGTPRAKDNSLPLGTTFYTAAAGNLQCVRRTNTYGCTSLFNIGIATSTFRHKFPSATIGNIATAGQEMANNYNFTLPASADISRPFQLAYNWGAVPTEFSLTPYSSIRCSSAIISRFYGHNDGALWEGSTLIRLQNPSSSNAFIVVNGLAQTVESGSAFIGRYAVISLMHSYFTCGLTGVPNRIVQLPRVEIKEPNITTELNNPSTINITWSTEWKRWDGQKYSTAYADDFEETESDLRYSLLYSMDNGNTWLHVVDNSPATLGIPDKNLWVSDAVTDGNETYTWIVSDTGYFIEGSYIVMVEAYRNSQDRHYSYHKQKIFINR